MQRTEIEHIIRSHRAYLCLDCGKCTSVCPISWRDPSFSPRTLVEAFRLDGSLQILEDDRLWECLTCGRCTQICPSDVHFLEFVRDVRSAARDISQEGHCSHGATIQTWMRMMSEPSLKQNRVDWLKPSEENPPYLQELRTAAPGASDTVYFSGCLPYFQVLFGKSGAQGIEIAQSAIKLLNLLDVEPIVLADERCCGHDLLWEGEVDTFKRLVDLNTRALLATGAKRIVTTCPECARTLRMDYDLDMEVMHIAEYLAQQADTIHEIYQRTGQADKPKLVTYQDPCRLGRHLGVYEEPRALLEAAGLKIEEMAHNRGRALCCGTSAWTHCGATAKAIQVDRLKEAIATNAEVMVTACAKCQIHFKCAQNDPQLKDELEIEIEDMITLLVKALSN